MSIVIQNGNQVRVCDSKTLQTTYAVTPVGRITGQPMMQGDKLVVPTIENGHPRTKIYNAKTGQLEASI
jgi:hypothetical protein